MKRIICVLVAAGAVLAASAQDIYKNVLQSVEEGSTTLRALHEQALARKAENHTGLTPADPEVEFGYLWAHPSAGGNRKDVAFSQQFDFPTAYVERAKLAGALDRTSELDYLQQRQQLLLQAKQTCVELVYQNALCRLSGKIEYNKAALNLTEMESQLREAQVTRQQLLVTLSAMAGGKDITFDLADYPAPLSLPTDFEAWFAQAASASPALQYLGAQVEASRRQVRVARAQGLPKFSVGYTGELVPSQNYNGVSVGMSIPLWENKGKVRQARAEASAAQLAAQDARVQYYTQLRGLYEQARQQQQGIAAMEASLGTNDHEAMLRRAYEGGEMTLLTYLMENAYYLSVRTRQLEAKRDLELTLASLSAFSL